MKPSIPPRLAAAAWLLGLAPTALAAPQDNDQLFRRLDANGDGQVELSEAGGQHLRLFERLVRRGDQDGDGRLNAAEFAAGLTPSTPPKPIVEEPPETNPASDALRLLLLKLDANGDATVTEDETPRGLERAFRDLVEAVDQDDDNRVAYLELLRAAGPAARVAVRVGRQQGWDTAAELRRLDARQGERAKRFNSRPNPRDALMDPRLTEELFARLDGNSDGRLERKEVSGEAEQYFGRFLQAADRDRSGDVSLEEFDRQAQRLAKTLGRAEERQAMMSEGGSAMMSGGAADPAPRNRRSQREGGRGAMLQRLRQMDANRDGAIGRDEATGFLRQRFDRLDANDDDRLDAGELRKAAEQFQSRGA